MTTLVAGVDTSTQACKVVVRDAATGHLVRAGRASHPAGTSVAPSAWADAFRAAAAAAGGLDDVAALSVGGQQHGMVCLDEDGAVVRDALLWNDVRSAGAAADLIRELGDGDEDAGRRAWADAVGVVPGGLLHRDQAALAGRRRAGARRPDRRRLPAPRLADLAAGGRPEPGLPRHRPRRRQRHRLLVGPHRRVPARPPGTGDARPPARRPPGGRPGRGAWARCAAGPPCSGRARATTRRPPSGWPRGRAT